MNAYLDTSVLLRLMLGEPAAIDDLSTYEHLVSSELIAVESHRTIDRLRLQGALTVDAAIAALDRVNEWLQSVDQVLLRAPVLQRASEPLPTPLGTLDAIHLATARLWRDHTNQPLIVVTHDAALGLAARTFGFEVRGT